MGSNFFQRSKDSGVAMTLPAGSGGEDSGHSKVSFWIRNLKDKTGSSMKEYLLFEASGLAIYHYSLQPQSASHRR